MKWIEKTTATLLVISAVASASLYGVWEEKVLLCAPLLVLVYLAAAVWALAASRGRGQKSEIRGQRSDQGGPTSDFRLPTSGSMIPPGGIVLFLFWLYSAAMIHFSVLPYEAKISTLRFGCYLAVYWVTANSLSRFSYRKTVWTAVFAALVFISLYSLVQHKVASDMIFGMKRYADYGERLAGTYQCPNHIAHLFQMWLPLCLVFLFIPQFGWFWRICFAYALPLFLLLIYQTQSRAGLLGSIMAVGVTVLFLVLRKSRKAFMIALLAAPLFGAAAIGGLWAGSSMFRTRMQPVVKFFEHHMQEDMVEVEFKDFRPQTWADTLVMIKERPVFGFGPGNYALTYEDYRTRFTGVRIETVHPHNEYVELLAEYGAVGGLLVLCVLASVSVKLIRFIKTSDRPYHALPAAALLGTLAGTAVHGFFDFELRIFPNAMMLALLAGCAVAPLLAQQKSGIRDQKSETGNPKSAARSLTSVLRLLISALLLLAAVWSVQVMSSAWIRAYGDRFLAEQKFRKAETWFTAAKRIDPQNWMADWGLGQVYYHYRYYELDPARKHQWAVKEQAAHASAYRINPKKEEVVYGLGRVELFLGNRERGLDLLRQAANYKRFNDFYWRKLGIELRKAGLYDEALEAFEYAQKLDRSNSTVKKNIQWLKKHPAQAGYPK